MHKLVDMYPKTVHLVNFGRSAEGRDIFGLTISAAEDDESSEENGKKKKKKKKKQRRLRKQKDKLGFVIQGAQHAREVLTLIPDPKICLIANLDCITVDSNGHISLYKPRSSGKHIWTTFSDSPSQGFRTHEIFFLTRSNT